MKQTKAIAKSIALYMKVIPVPFNTQGAKMLQHTKSLLEDKDSLLLIDRRYDKLLIALRTAVATEYKLDKEATSYDDILDALRLSLQLYHRSNKRVKIVSPDPSTLPLPKS